MGPKQNGSKCFVIPENRNPRAMHLLLFKGTHSSNLDKLWMLFQKEKNRHKQGTHFTGTSINLFPASDIKGSKIEDCRKLFTMKNNNEDPIKGRNIVKESSKARDLICKCICVI